jgi:hypothetical protein
MPHFHLLTLLSSIATAVPAGASHDAPGSHSTHPPGLITAPLLDPIGSSRSMDADAITGRGNRFSKKQKAVLKERNAAANEGKVVCENCNVETVPAEKHEKNVTPPNNEAHTDHKIPRAKGGKADLDNGQILCRECNLKKSDKTE